MVLHFATSNNIARSDAAELVRTIMEAVQYIHDSDIVHRNLNPKNMLFTTGNGSREFPCILRGNLHVQYTEIPCTLYENG
jgi:serine/threonine protein kinase